MDTWRTGSPWGEQQTASRIAMFATVFAVMPIDRRQAARWHCWGGRPGVAAAVIIEGPGGAIGRARMLNRPRCISSCGGGGA